MQPTNTSDVWSEGEENRDMARKGLGINLPKGILLLRTANAFV